MRKSLVSGLEQPATSLAHIENLQRQMRSRIVYRVRVEKITLVCYSVFHSSNLRLFGISQLVSHIYTFSQCFHFVCCCSGLTAWRSYYCRCRSLRRVHIFVYNNFSSSRATTSATTIPQPHKCTFAYIIQYERSPVTACVRCIMSQAQYQPAQNIYVNTSSSSSSVSCNIQSIQYSTSSAAGSDGENVRI